MYLNNAPSVNQSPLLLDESSVSSSGSQMFLVRLINYFISLSPNSFARLHFDDSTAEF